ncbi:MAG: zinc-binding dehydrogenase [Desulfurellaceae bacterium]|nr:zinc-binding dehydrogenase [Desulfurellaceae bacterium]
MKAMRLAEFGSPENLRLEEAPDPELREGHVVIRVKATGINPADLVRMSGKYPQPLPLPYIPGTDVAGEVEAIGAGVGHVRVGERVFGRSLNGGGYAEKACLPTNEIFPLPENLSFAEGAAIPVPFYTAYVALHHKAQLKEGETVLISAGGGGVGVAAIQLAKAAGARVITTVGSQEKAERTKELGADIALNYKEQDFAAEVQSLTDGKGVDVIIENVAADNFAQDFNALGRHGRIVLIGTGTGKAPESTFMTGAALFKEATIYGMALPNSVALIPDIANALIPLFADQKVKAMVHKSYPLVEAQQALQDLVAGKVFGKLVLAP